VANVQNGATVTQAGSAGLYILGGGTRQYWTPTFNATVGGTNAAYGYQAGTYWYDGSRLDFTFNLSVTSQSGYGGTALIAGFPFAYNALSNQTAYCDIGEHAGVVLDSGYTQLIGIMPPSGGVGKLIQLAESGGGVSTQLLSASAFSSSFVLGGKCTVAYGG
jgi:hypothetical protein